MMPNQTELPEFRIDECGHGWRVLVGTRPVKTPAGNELVSPKQELASIIITELRASIEEKAPPGPASKLVNTVLDRAGEDRGAWVASAAAQLLEDALLIRVPEPEALRQMQDRHAEVFLRHAENLLGPLPSPSISLAFPKPDEKVFSKAESFLHGLDDFSLLSLVGMGERCRSFLMAYGHLHGGCGVGELGDYLFAEEVWQEKLWGEDTEALDRRRHMLDDLASFSRIACLATQNNQNEQ